MFQWRGKSVFASGISPCLNSELPISHNQHRGQNLSSTMDLRWAPKRRHEENFVSGVLGSSSTAHLCAAWLDTALLALLYHMSFPLAARQKASEKGCNIKCHKSKWDSQTGSPCHTHWCCMGTRAVAQSSQGESNRVCPAVSPGFLQVIEIQPKESFYGPFSIGG